MVGGPALGRSRGPLPLSWVNPRNLRVLTLARFPSSPASDKAARKGHGLHPRSPKGALVSVGCLRGWVQSVWRGLCPRRQLTSSRSHSGLLSPCSDTLASWAFWRRVRRHINLRVFSSSCRALIPLTSWDSDCVAMSRRHALSSLPLCTGLLVGNGVPISCHGAKHWRGCF